MGWRCAPFSARALRATSTRAHHVAEGRHQPRTHADHQGVGAALAGGQFLVGDMLVGEVLADAGQSLAKGVGQATADLAVHHHQHLGLAVEAAGKVVVEHLVAEVVHHRPCGRQRKALGDPQVIAVERAQVDDAASRSRRVSCCTHSASEIA